MGASKGPSAPADLAERGKRFWRQVWKEYDLNVDEVELLAEACRTLDECDRLRQRVATDGDTVPGSTGQLRLHPALVELRLARAGLGKLLAQLGLPDLETGDAPQTAAQRRSSAASQARWKAKREEQERRAALASGGQSW